jgi:hypothetical protein
LQRTANPNRLGNDISFLYNQLPAVFIWRARESPGLRNRLPGFPLKGRQQAGGQVAGLFGL